MLSDLLNPETLIGTNIKHIFYLRKNPFIKTEDLLGLQTCVFNEIAMMIGTQDNFRMTSFQVTP